MCCKPTHFYSEEVPVGVGSLKTPNCVTLIPEFIHYSTFAVQSCIIGSQGSTHHLLLMMCKRKLNSSLSVTKSNASEAKHMNLQGTTLLLWARASATLTTQHQQCSIKEQQQQQSTRPANRHSSAHRSHPAPSHHVILNESKHTGLK